MVKISKARLSANPETKVVAHPEGVNGQVNVTENGKKFYLYDMKVRVDRNTSKTERVMVWENEDGHFPFSAEEHDEDFAGRQEGELELFDVDPYEVEGNTYDYVRLIVLKGEDRDRVLRRFEKTQEWIKANPRKESAPAA